MGLAFALLGCDVAPEHCAESAYFVMYGWQGSGVECVRGQRVEREWLPNGKGILVTCRCPKQGKTGPDGGTP